MPSVSAMPRSKMESAETARGDRSEALHDVYRDAASAVPSPGRGSDPGSRSSAGDAERGVWSHASLAELALSRGAPGWSGSGAPAASGLAGPGLASGARRTSASTDAASGRHFASNADASPFDSGAWLGSADAAPDPPGQSPPLGLPAASLMAAFPQGGAPSLSTASLGAASAHGSGSGAASGLDARRGSGGGGAADAAGASLSQNQRQNQQQQQQHQQQLHQSQGLTAQGSSSHGGSHGGSAGHSGRGSASPGGALGPAPTATSAALPTAHLQAPQRQFSHGAQGEAPSAFALSSGSQTAPGGVPGAGGALDASFAASLAVTLNATLAQNGGSAALSLQALQTLQSLQASGGLSGNLSGGLSGSFPTQSASDAGVDANAAVFQPARGSAPGGASPGGYGASSGGYGGAAAAFSGSASSGATSSAFAPPHSSSSYFGGGGGAAHGASLSSGGLGPAGSSPPYGVPAATGGHPPLPPPPPLGLPPTSPLASALGSLGGYSASSSSSALLTPAVDMRSLSKALSDAREGTGETRRILERAAVRPRLPGLTRLVSKLSKEGSWRKALEVYEAAGAVGLTPDTALTNAAISACDKGGRWQEARSLFWSMGEEGGPPRDAITYSATISALARGKQWRAALACFEHMAKAGVRADVVACCSLINALERGGQWALAERLFLTMSGLPPSALSGDASSDDLDAAARAAGAVDQDGSAEAPRRGDDAGPDAEPAGGGVGVGADLAADGASSDPGSPAEAEPASAGGRRQAAGTGGASASASAATPPASGSSSAQRSATSSPPTPAAPHRPHTSFAHAAGVAPNRVCCNALLSAYARARPARWDRCMRLLSIMTAGGPVLRPDVVSFNTALKACCAARQPRVACVVYRAALAARVRPNSATFGCLVSVASDAGDAEMLRAVAGWLAAAGHDVAGACASALAEAIARVGGWDAVAHLQSGGDPGALAQGAGYDSSANALAGVNAAAAALAAQMAAMGAGGSGSGSGSGGGGGGSGGGYAGSHQPSQAGGYGAQPSALATLAAMGYGSGSPAQQAPPPPAAQAASLPAALARLPPGLLAALPPGVAEQFAANLVTAQCAGYGDPGGYAPTGFAQQRGVEAADPQAASSPPGAAQTSQALQQALVQLLQGQAGAGAAHDQAAPASAFAARQGSGEQAFPGLPPSAFAGLPGGQMPGAAFAPPPPSGAASGSEGLATTDAILAAMMAQTQAPARAGGSPTAAQDARFGSGSPYASSGALRSEASPPRAPPSGGSRRDSGESVQSSALSSSQRLGSHPNGGPLASPASAFHHPGLYAAPLPSAGTGLGLYPPAGAYQAVGGMYQARIPYQATLAGLAGLGIGDGTDRGAQGVESFVSLGQASQASWDPGFFGAGNPPAPPSSGL